MPHWIIKSAIQRAISGLPRRQRWNEMFQKMGTKTLGLGEGMFELRLKNCQTHLDNFWEFQSESSQGFNALELGTGWYPTIAIGLFLCGANHVWAIDLDPLLHRSRLRRLVQLFCQYDEQKRLEKFLPRLRPDRMAQLREFAPFVEQESPQDFLARFNIHALVLDAQHTGLPAGSVDFCLSHGVLEYIPRPVLEGILKEFIRLSSARAVMSHWITMVDQFSVFDRTITPFNYLRYTQRQWRWLNSPLMSQNRLRAPEYRELLLQAGNRIVKETNTSGTPEDLQKICLAPEFRGFTTADLLILTSWLVTRPAGS